MKLRASDSGVLHTLQLVANKIAPKYTFGYHSVEDIYQECIIMGMDALDRYDGRAPLENFLSTHVSNRVKSFLRDNYYRKYNNCEYCNQQDPECKYCRRRTSINATKKNLMEPIDLNSVQIEGETHMYFEPNNESKLENQELLEKIDKELPKDMREDYLKILAKVYVPKSRREEIKNKIREIISE